MTIEETIKKAIEGGWKVEFYGMKPLITSLEDLTEEGMNDILGFMLQYNLRFQMLLYPQFWQALGKAMGWESTGLFKAKTDGNPPKEIMEWLLQWHSFIDHLAEGGSIEGFFEKL